MISLSDIYFYSIFPANHSNKITKENCMDPDMKHISFPIYKLILYCRDSLGCGFEPHQRGLQFLIFFFYL